MAINWDGFTNSVKSYLKSRSAPNYQAAAKFIALQYDVSVRSGGEMLANNFVIKPNTSVLQTMIELSFMRGYTKQQGYYDSLELIAKGLTLYWMGATMAQVYPPPGTIAVLSNWVVSPGTATSILTVPTMSFDNWTDMFVIMAKGQLLSMTGMMVALIPTSFGPMPIVLQWTGYR